MILRVVMALAIASAFIAAYALFKRRGAGRGSDARRLVAAGARLVDVRTPQEFATDHIPGAINIPVQDLERRMTELAGKERPVVVYCRSGRRSASAARMLESAGYAAVHDLGSMTRW